MRKWFRDYWQVIPIIVALALLAVTLFINPSSFQNLAWYALVVLTAIYAYATIMIVRATSKQTEETKHMIDEMRQSRLDAVKPSLSLQPGGFFFGAFGAFGGSFKLYLMNSGGIAKDVRIDIETNNPDSKKTMFVPAISREHKVSLWVPGETQGESGLIKVNVSFKDGYNHNFTGSLSIDFSELVKEGREIRGQYSELDEIQKVLEEIERKIKW